MNGIQNQRVCAGIMMGLVVLLCDVAIAETPPQCLDYKQFVNGISELDLYMSDGLVEQAKQLHAICHGETFDYGDSLQKVEKAAALSGEKKEVLEQLILDRVNDVKFRVDKASGNLTSLEFRYVAPAATPTLFFDELYSTFGADLEELFGLGIADSFETRWDISSAPGDEGNFAYEVTLQRVHKGIAYAGNRLEVLFTERDSGVFALNMVLGNISNAVPLGDCPSVLDKGETETLVATMDGDFKVDLTLQSSAPEIRDLNGTAFWTQSVPIESDTLGDLYRAVFDLATRQLLFVQEPANLKTGTILLPTNRPFEDFETEGKNDYGIPLVDICDDTTTSSGVTVCDTGTFLDTTDYDGDFVVSDQAGNIWFIDFNGDWLYDVGVEKKTECDPEITNLTAQIVYSSDLDVSWTGTNCRGRRGEVYYHMNYARLFANTLGYYSGMAQPLEFYVQISDTHNSCSSGGQSGDRIRITCGSNAHTLVSMDNPGEKDSRDTMYHEYSHSLSESIAGSVAWNCDDYCYPRALEEGWVKYSAMMMSHHEFASGGFQEDYSFPEDWTASNRAVGVVAMLAGFHNQVGYSAYTSVLNSRIDQSNSTILIGSDANDCSTDTDEDGYVTIDDCSDYSYYKNLLTRDQGKWAWGSEHGVEISRAFHRHASDANPETGGNQEFPWRDDVSNLSQKGPFIPLEFPESSLQLNLTYGPDYPDLPTWSGDEAKLSFDYTTDGGTQKDIDKFTLFARAGEHYVVETHTLTNTDTIIEIRDQWWTATVYKCGGAGTSNCYDDDGGSGLASKLDFYPTSTGWYRLYVYPYSTSDCGPDTKYQLRYSIEDDDYGDSLSAANPISINSSTKYGNIDSSNDYDWFYFYAPSSGTLNYFICSQDSITPEIRLYDSSGTYLTDSLYAHETCGTRHVSHTLNSAGLYYARVARSSGNTSGGFEVNIYMSSTDLDSDTKATAFDISNMSSAPYDVIATDIDDSGDDIDWFKFDADANEHWTITTFTLADDVDTVMEIYAADGSGMQYDTPYIIKDDDGGYDDQWASRIVFVVPRDGYYYVKVTEYGTNGTGRYDILFSYDGTSTTVPPAFP